MVGYKSMESSDLSARSWVSTLGWYEVWVVAACSAVPCVFMLAVFELQRHRRTSFWPRARYCPGKVLDSQYPGFGAWLAPLKAIPDDEMVELVGLEAFGGALSDTFYSWTIGNVVHRSGRLWAPVVGVYLIVAHALYELFAECKAFVRLRQAFMTTAEKAAEGANIGEHGQLQSTFSVMIERIPSECRADVALKAYFDHLFPGEVASRGLEAIPFYTAVLSQLNAKRTELLKRLYLAEQKIEDEAALVVTTDREALLANDDRLDAYGEEAGNAQIVAAAVGADVIYEVTVAAGDAAAAAAEPAAAGREGESPGRRRDALVVQGLGRLGRARRRAFSLRSEKPRLGTKGGTGFVTFRSLRSAAIARQAQLSPRPFCMEAADHRPEPRNVIWANVTSSKTERLVRHNIMSLALACAALNWSMVMELCEKVSNVCIFWDNNTTNYWLSYCYELMQAYAPILLVNLILCILPFILMFIGKYYERFKFTSEVQQTVFRRYLMFELANIWLALVSGTIWTLLELLAEEPVTVLEYIALIMPQAAVYFVEMIIMKLMLVLPFEISRLWPWFRIEFVRRSFKDRLTDRDLTKGAFEPPEFRYGFQYPSKLMVLTYAFVFAGIAPIVYPFALVFFYCAYFVYTRQFLYVYVPYYEAGGAFFEIIIYSLIGSLFSGCLTFTFYLLVSKAYYHALASTGPLLATLIAWIFFQVGFGHMNQNLALESAIAADEAYDAASGDEPTCDAFTTEYFRQPALLQGTLEPVLPWHDKDEDKAVASPYVGKQATALSRARSSILFRRAANNDPTLTVATTTEDRKEPPPDAEHDEDLGDNYRGPAV
ncbi:hypothetical protein JL721_5487 [Aureococcus anophagefferens]|nr:hypothetical protein JL721_5487 [Aureococcus anophagefferens]